MRRGASLFNLSSVALGLAWALPNVLLGALIIVPIWFVAYLFRPPGQSRE